METSDTTSSNAFLDKYLTPIAVLVGALIIGGALYFGNGSNSTPQAVGDAAPSAVNIKDVKLTNAIVIGDLKAPVTIAYWFDYQCPFCKKFDQESMGKIYDTYVKTGKVKIVLKDFQFLGPESIDAGVFARAMWEANPDQFFAWYQAMFEAQDEEHGGFGDTASIVAMTKSKFPAIDTDRVLALATSKRAQYETAIAADREEGSTLGVSGTPATIIGKRIFSGAQPFTTIQTAIEAELK